MKKLILIALLISPPIECMLRQELAKYEQCAKPVKLPSIAKAKFILGVVKPISTEELNEIYTTMVKSTKSEEKMRRLNMAFAVLLSNIQAQKEVSHIEKPSSSPAVVQVCLGIPIKQFSGRVRIKKYVGTPEYVKTPEYVGTPDIAIAF